MPRIIVPQDIVSATVAKIDAEIQLASRRTEALRAKRAAAIVAGHKIRVGDVVTRHGDEYLVESVSTHIVTDRPGMHARKRKKDGSWSKRASYLWGATIFDVASEGPPPPVQPDELPQDLRDPALVAALAKADEIAREQPVSQGRTPYESGRVSAACEIIAAAAGVGV